MRPDRSHPSTVSSLHASVGVRAWRMSVYWDGWKYIAGSNSSISQRSNKRLGKSRIPICFLLEFRIWIIRLESQLILMRVGTELIIQIANINVPSQGYRPPPRQRWRWVLHRWRPRNHCRASRRTDITSSWRSMMISLMWCVCRRWCQSCQRCRDCWEKGPRGFFVTKITQNVCVK